jgi:hypothetical protein
MPLTAVQQQSAQARRQLITTLRTLVSTGAVPVREGRVAHIAAAKMLAARACTERDLPPAVQAAVARRAHDPRRVTLMFLFWFREAKKEIEEIGAEAQKRGANE